MLARLRRDVALAASAAGVIALVAPANVRTILVVVVVLVAPGTAAVRLVGIPWGLTAAVVTVACGLAVTEALSMLLLYLQVWSWQAVLMIVCSVSAIAAMVPIGEDPIAQEAAP